MKDAFAREITYLRLSVTDRCNLRCRYCMPPEGTAGGLCSAGELLEIVRQAAAFGIRKVRLTGGEPLVRPDILDICRGAAATAGVEELCLTTNGTRLPAMARPLREAGVDRLNVSLDTLRPDRFARLTGQDCLGDVLRGLEAAAEAGFTGCDSCCQDTHATFAAKDRVVDQHDTVLYHDTHQHDHTDQCHYTQRRLCDRQSQDNPGKGERDREHNHKRVGQRRGDKRNKIGLAVTQTSRNVIGHVIKFRGNALNLFLRFVAYIRTVAQGARYGVCRAICRRRNIFQFYSSCHNFPDPQ